MKDLAQLEREADLAALISAQSNSRVRDLNRRIAQLQVELKEADRISGLAAQNFAIRKAAQLKEKLGRISTKEQQDQGFMLTSDFEEVMGKDKV